MHSIVLKPSGEVPAEALFLSVSAGKCTGSPEVYPRPDGFVYLCGMSDEDPLPPRAEDVPVRSELCDSLREIAALVSPHLSEENGAEFVRGQACFLPYGPDEIPCVGPVAGIDGAYTAFGHSCWGILTSPSTGLAIAELVLTGECKSVDLSRVSPARFST